MERTNQKQIQRYCNRNYPDCRVDITGRHGVVITDIEGHRRRISVRRRITDKEPPIIGLVYLIVPGFIWMMALIMLFTLIMAKVYGGL